MTIDKLVAMKGKRKIVMITAYDALFAKIFDENVDMVLVGDSLNMSFNGKSETIGVSVDEMIYHSKAVKSGLKHAFLVVDMPFGSCATPQIALENCIKVYMQTGCDAVKIEGGREMSETISLLARNGISVMAHIGLRPQMSRFEGGYKVKGKSDEVANSILQDAHELENAGAAMLLIEGTIPDVATTITREVSVPVIGIGSGKNCDGQVLVWSDALGFFDEFKPKFVKRYLDGANLVREAVKKYAEEVRNEQFPSRDHEYSK